MSRDQIFGLAVIIGACLPVYGGPMVKSIFNKMKGK